MNYVLSTIGTSLLTNCINRGDSNEATWLRSLRDSANLSQKESSAELKAIIQELEARALESLRQDPVRASAEMNGLSRFYSGDLSRGSQDIHVLIGTDTWQSNVTGEVIEKYLREQGIFNVQFYAPRDLRTTNTQEFQAGLDSLLEKLEGEVPGYREAGYRVIFNLVGGYKGVQAFLNTCGMFYADEILYIFEGSASELIRIPRLPVKIDLSHLKASYPRFLFMSMGGQLPVNELREIPESMLFILDDKATLSQWGKLAWMQVKREALSEKLFELPRLVYETALERDFKAIADKKKKESFQETLGRVSVLLEESGGDTSALKGGRGGGLKYDKYTNSALGHFRTDRGDRFACLPEKGKLRIVRYGDHDEMREVRKQWPSA